MCEEKYFQNSIEIPESWNSDRPQSAWLSAVSNADYEYENRKSVRRIRGKLSALSSSF